MTGKTVIAKDGKFGTYVTDGETNASLTRGDRLEHMSPERAFELLAARRANPPEPKKKSRDKKTKPETPETTPENQASKPKKSSAPKKKAKPKKSEKSDD